MFLLPQAIATDLPPVKTAEGRPAHYVGQSAAVVQKMAIALAHLDKKQVEIQSEEQHVYVSESGHVIYEKQPQVEWAYDGKALFLKDIRHKHFYRGLVPRFRVLEAVTLATGERLDPFTRSLLLRRTPFAEVFEDCTVKLVGSISLKGVLCKIVKAEANDHRVSLYLRATDYLPIASSSELLIDGKALPGLNRTFHYQVLSKVTKSLDLPKGYTVKPLPQLPSRNL